MNLGSKESIVLATILHEGADDLSPFLKRLIDNAPESFDDPRHGKIAVAIRHLIRKGEIIHAGSVADAIGNGFDCAVDYIRGLLGSNIGVQAAEYEAQCLWEAFGPRRLAGIGLDLQNALNAAPQQFKSIASRVQDAIELIVSDDGTESDIESRRFCAERTPPPFRAVYTLNDCCIATPGNIQTLTAGIKVGKTAALEAAMASTMAGVQNADCFGFWSDNPQCFALLHFDCEQSPDDHWFSIHRILKRAGLSSPPPWFYSYCLTGKNHKQGWQAVQAVIRRAGNECPGFHSVFLDGAADFVADVNDAAECNAFVAALHDLAIAKDCPITSVIHFNPGSEKSRGHLGSQLERKAETNLRLDKTDGVTVIWSDKQRRAPILKDSGPCFRWNDELKMHVSVAPLRELKDESKREKLRLLFGELFDGRPGMKYSEMVEKLQEKPHKLSPTTAENRIHDAAKLGVIAKGVARIYTLAVYE